MWGVLWYIAFPESPMHCLLQPYLQSITRTQACILYTADSYGFLHSSCGPSQEQVVFTTSEAEARFYSAYYCHC